MPQPMMQKSLSGKAVELYVESMSVSHMKMIGEPFVMVKARKRPDIENQRTDFDTEYVTNHTVISPVRKPREVHSQAISNTAALKILKANPDKYEYGKKESMGFNPKDFTQQIDMKDKNQVLTFKANVYYDDKVNHCYYINPNSIEPSDFPDVSREELNQKEYDHQVIKSDKLMAEQQLNNQHDDELEL